MANLDWILNQNLSKGNYKTRSYDNLLLYSRYLTLVTSIRNPASTFSNVPTYPSMLIFRCYGSI